MRRSIWIWGVRRDSEMKEKRFFCTPWWRTSPPQVMFGALPINPAAGNVTSTVSHLAVAPVVPCGAAVGTARCLLCPPESAAPCHIWSSRCGTMWAEAPYFSCHLLLSVKGFGFGGHHRQNMPAFHGIGFVRKGGIRLPSEQVKSCRNICLIREITSTSTAHIHLQPFGTLYVKGFVTEKSGFPRLKDSVQKPHLQSLNLFFHREAF